jgi:hypothetical protein
MRDAIVTGGASIEDRRDPELFIVIDNAAGYSFGSTLSQPRCFL